MNIHDQVRDHLATLPERPDTDELVATLALAEATIAALRDELADHKDGLFRRDGELAGLRLRLRDKTDIILRQDIELSRLRRRLIAQEAVPAPRRWDLPLAVAVARWDALSARWHALDGQTRATWRLAVAVVAAALLAAAVRGW